MLSSTFIQNLKRIVPQDNILLNEPMSRHTTFRAGGEAACLIKVQNAEQLSKLLRFLNQSEREYFVLGNGSNLLVGDKGYEGVIMQLAGEFGTVSTNGTLLKAGAGVPLSKAARAAAEAGLSGLEFASGIPGSVGGAVVMNAGAYGGEMRQIAECVEVMDQEGNVLELDNGTMEFGYRTSVVRNRPFVVLNAAFRLTEGEKDKILEKMQELALKRKEKQPLEYPSAGSTFKRPEGYFAGKLIMDAGMRGFRIGGAQVSEKHCGFIVNSGNASAADISELIEEVQERVKEKFGVVLETEVIRLGQF